MEITKDNIMGMNKKEIEAALNSCLDSLKYTSIEQSSVKREMFEHLKRHTKDLDLYMIDYLGNSFSINLGSVHIKVKSSAKSTNEIIKVSKLKSKYVKEKGAFKISDISVPVKHPCYKFSDAKKWTIEIENDWTSSGDPSYVELKNYSLPLNDMLNVDFLLKAIDEQEFKAEYRRNPWKGFRNEIATDVAQPILKVIFLKHFGINDEFIKTSSLKVPKPFDKLIPSKVETVKLFEIIVDIVGQINSDLIDDVMKNKTFNLI